MYKRINTQAQLQKYLESRFNLSQEIIVKLAEKVTSMSKNGSLDCFYNRQTDNIYLKHTKFSVVQWLLQHYTQCTGCGVWYTPNDSETIFATSNTVMYSRMKGREVILPNCAPCTLEWPTKTLHTLDQKMMDYDIGKVELRDCFYPVPHVKD